MSLNRKPSGPPDRFSELLRECWRRDKADVREPASVEGAVPQEDGSDDNFFGRRHLPEDRIQAAFVDEELERAPRRVRDGGAIELAALERDGVDNTFIACKLGQPYGGISVGPVVSHGPPPSSRWSRLCSSGRRALTLLVPTSARGAR